MESKPITINLPVIPRKRRKDLALAILGVFLFSAIVWWSNTSSYNRALKKANKDNKVKIDSIQATKYPLLDSLEVINQYIIAKDEFIKTLSRKENELNLKLKYSKNENRRIKNTYRNSTINQRIKQWAELTTEADSAATYTN